MSVPIWWQKQILREKLLMSGFDNQVGILRTIGEGFDQLLYRTLFFFLFSNHLHFQHTRAGTTFIVLKPDVLLSAS